MAKAHLKMYPTTDTKKCWDNLILIVNDEENIIAPYIVFKNRDSAFALLCDIGMAGIEGHEGELTVNIDGRNLTLSESAQEVVVDVLTDLVSDYFECSDFN